MAQEVNASIFLMCVSEYSSWPTLLKMGTNRRFFSKSFEGESYLDGHWWCHNLSNNIKKCMTGKTEQISSPLFFRMSTFRMHLLMPFPGSNKTLKLISLPYKQHYYMCVRRLYNNCDCIRQYLAGVKAGKYNPCICLLLSRKKNLSSG